MDLISPPMTLESSSLTKPVVSKLKPDAKPTFYARLLATAATTNTAEWRAMEKATADLGVQTWGEREFEILRQNGAFRSPFRRDVAGKGYASDIIAFLNVKANEDYPPAIVGRDGLPLMDHAMIYPGCVVRISLRAYAYGGRGTQYGAGIAFGLKNVQWLSDGPRLKNARSGGAEFGRIDDDEFDAFNH